ncbi:MAG TPA: hypothetical protein ENJ08_06820 [Gammaproteobacteria bacterium]|nr:hypothetical protein [Gammaproteobacteria bacterium]
MTYKCLLDYAATGILYIIMGFALCRLMLNSPFTGIQATDCFNFIRTGTFISYQYRSGAGLEHGRSY